MPQTAVSLYTGASSCPPRTGGFRLFLSKEQGMDGKENKQPKEGRKRGLTSVALQWLADKMRRTQRIKEELQRGTYQVDSNKIAEAILNGDSQPKS